MDRTVGIEDVAGVKSRVSWGAIFGGAVIALAVYLLLTIFFSGVGLSLTELGVRTGTAATIAIVAGVLSVILAMFCGGCVTSVLTAGETRQEAMLHGVLTWALVTAMAIGLVGMGIRSGYNALLGVALVASNTESGQRAQTEWEQMAREAGIPQERIEQAKQGLNPDQARNPEAVEDARRGAMIAAWSMLVGTLLSIGAAVLGALATVGPTFRLFPGATTVVTAERRDITVGR